MNVSVDGGVQLANLDSLNGLRSGAREKFVG